MIDDLVRLITLHVITADNISDAAIKTEVLAQLTAAGLDGSGNPTTTNTTWTTSSDPT